jgi:hypothetical protein
MNPFPLLAAGNHRRTSPPTSTYNCIAWAAGHSDKWWWPDSAQQAFWPSGVPRALTLQAFIQAYQSLGYVLCDHNGVESGYEKVAIYLLKSRPTHAARQLPSGVWTSKLGKNHDIEHELGAIEGPLYGQVGVYMKRPALRVPDPPRAAALASTPTVPQAAAVSDKKKQALARAVAAAFAPRR